MSNIRETRGLQPLLLDVRRPYFAEHLLTPELSAFSPVIALSIFDYSTTENGLIVPSTRILAGVRDPQTNLTDPDVISLPTKRILAHDLQSIIMPYSIAKIATVGSRESNKKVVVEWDKKNIFDQRGAKTVLDCTRSLMREKLGVTDALEDQSLKIIRAEPKVSFLAKVYGTNKDPEHGEEFVHMVGMNAFVQFKTNPFPNDTSSYYSLQFMRADEYSKLVVNKDPYLSMRFGDLLKVCPGGLCVLTGDKIIKDATEQR